MRVFLAGGTGVIGRGLIPALVAAGHEVTATTRRADRADALRRLGARPAVVDVLDAPRLAAAVAEAVPELILHELTDLAGIDFEANARLRREGTANLVAAAQAAGVPRMFVESIAWAYAAGDGVGDRAGPWVESDPIEPGSAVDEMERLVRDGVPHATVLRYGLLYGPGTWYAPGARIANAVLASEVPATPAVSTFLHIDDAVAATVAALDWPDGAYNVTDDEPAPATTWLPVYAAELGAPPPRFEPLPDGVHPGRGASNAKARALGWVPEFASWRVGFLEQ